MEFKFKKSLFNLDLLVLTKEQTKQMTPVTKLNIFEPSSNNFDPSGLFSTEIFGQVGSTERNTLFSYIDLKVSILHPLIYKHVTTLRAFYKDVMAGKRYAVYDKKLKDIVPASEEDGQTGYEYFISILNNIELLDNDSDLRAFKVAMVAQYATPGYMLKELLVLPAGVRDYIMSKSGKPEEDEINDKYRKVMMLANSISNITVTKETLYAIDSIRFRIQESILDIYEYIMSLLDGKRKFIQGKWGSRGILYGTRNVITPSLARVTDLDIPDRLSIEHTTVGLFQYAKAITPITMNKIHTTFIGRLFSPDTSSVYLVSPKTMETTLVEVSVKERDAWLTLDGLDHLLGTLAQEDIRSEPIMIHKHYLLLVHDDGKKITPIFNTDTMNDDMDKSKLRPITYYELLYISLLETFDKYRALVTRYPVINLGGIYPSKCYIKTTDNPRKVTVVVNNRELIANEYPNFKEAYYNSLSPHYAFLEALGADYDGRQSNVCIYGRLSV